MAPLSEDQKVEMLRVTFPDERWTTTLRPTPEIEAAYREWLDGDCKHDVEPEIRRKPISGPKPQIVKICPDCGKQFGTPIAYANVPDPDQLPWLRDLNFDEYCRKRRESWRDQKIGFWQGQDSKVSVEYEEYLKSAKWKSKKSKIFERAEGLCEGCRDAPATQVHHLCYDHRFDEFLWELVAICDACHERAHEGQK